jgi:hypothetical protein
MPGADRYFASPDGHTSTPPLVTLAMSDQSGLGIE